MSDAVSRETSAAIEAVFGASSAAAWRYHALLASDGIEHGLVGPRERDRLWERHLLNSAVVEELVPPSAEVVDVGSGAGLPGIPLALVRPDLRLTLVEPLLRRSRFLEHVVETLDLGDRVTVVRGRAEDVAGTVSGDVVTSRALAPLERLARWCLPLVAAGGLVAAIKGSSAAEEVARDQLAVREAGGDDPRVVLCGEGRVDPPVHVVLVHRR